MDSINDEGFSAAEGVEDDSELESTSLSAYDINSYGADYPLDSLAKRMDNDAFVVPEFQRKHIWSKVHASRFIESLLMGLPVPSIFLYKRPEDGKHLVIDGQQRLRAIQGFYNEVYRGDKFTLRGVREPWEGLTYSELPADDQLRLDDSIMHAIIFNQQNPKDKIDSIHFVFERINSGGVHLSAQEIRNCIAQGQFTELTAELNKNEFWRNIYGKPSPRSKDQELIIRVLAFLERGNEYERPMSAFLDRFTQDMNGASAEKLATLRKSFEGSAELCWKALGKRAFRPDRALNAAVLESVMAALARRLRKKNAATPDPEKVERAYQSLLGSAEYQEGWKRYTAAADAVEKRTNAARKAFSSI